MLFEFVLGLFMISRRILHSLTIFVDGKVLLFLEPSTECP
jgi:hypothetical protein